MSLPATGDLFSSPYLNSYRVAAGRAAQSAAATAAPRRASSTSPKAACPFRPTRSRCPKQRLRRSARRGAAPARRPADPAVHRRPGGPGPAVRLAAAAPAGLPGDRHRSAEDDGDPLLRARQPGQQSRFRREHLRQRAAIRICPRTMPRSTSSIGPATPAASFWRRTCVGIPKKALGLPHVRRGHRTPAARRHVLDATRTSPTTTAAPSSSPAAIAAA